MQPMLTTFKITCILIVLAFSGCTGDPDRSRIVGDWEIATADHLMGQVNLGGPDDSSAAADSVDHSKAGDAPPMLIRFYNSGYLATATNMGNMSTQKQGNWKFLSYDAESRMAKIRCKLVDDTTDFDVIVDDENTLRLVPPNMAGLKKKLKFVRRQ